MSEAPNLISHQQTILDCVRNLKTPLPRSTIAKLLAGSRSTRVAGMEDDPFFGRLKQLPRKSLLHYIDTLIQQRYLAVDYQGNVVFEWDRGRELPEATDQ